MEKIGEVWVDAGCVWVGDPCYVFGKDSSFGPSSWSEYCDILDKAGHWNSDKDYIASLGEGIGLHIETLYGDGSYPVYAEYGEGFGGRGISRIIIDFDPQMDEDEFLYEEG